MVFYKIKIILNKFKNANSSDEPFIAFCNKKLVIIEKIGARCLNNLMEKMDNVNLFIIEMHFFF